MDNTPLLGKIISWPNIGDIEEDGFVPCGRGEVIAILADPMILIKRVPRKGDPEPPFMLTLPLTIPHIHFFDTLKEEEKWYNWIISGDGTNNVVSLVK